MPKEQPGEGRFFPSPTRTTTTSQTTTHLPTTETKLHNNTCKTQEAQHFFSDTLCAATKTKLFFCLARKTFGFRFSFQKWEPFLGASLEALTGLTGRGFQLRPPTARHDASHSVGPGDELCGEGVGSRWFGVGFALDFLLSG